MQLQIRWEKSPSKIIEAFQAKFPGVLDTVVRDVTATVEANVMVATPVKTGNARRNWLIKKIKDSVYVIYNKVKYVPHLEYGTKAHVINGNPYLVFKTENGWVRKKSVKHPGTAAIRMVRDQIPIAADLLRQKIQDTIKTLWNRR